MRLFALIPAALVASGLPLATAAAGLDKLHKQAVEGGRMCMSGHYHFMSSGAWPMRAQAMAVARRGWERFTAAEYGAAWADLRTAASVDYGCAASPSRRGEQWSCNLKARPCRRL